MMIAEKPQQHKQLLDNADYELSPLDNGNKMRRLYLMSSKSRAKLADIDDDVMMRVLYLGLGSCDGYCLVR